MVPGGALHNSAEVDGIVEQMPYSVQHQKKKVRCKQSGVMSAIITSSELCEYDIGKDFFQVTVPSDQRSRNSNKGKISLGTDAMVIICIGHDTTWHLVREGGAQRGNKTNKKTRRLHGTVENCVKRRGGRVVRLLQYIDHKYSVFHQVSTFCHIVVCP